MSDIPCFDCGKTFRGCSCAIFSTKKEIEEEIQKLQDRITRLEDYLGLA